MPDFPTAVPDIVDANVSETLFTMHGGAGHVPSTNRILINLRALATKLGINNGTAPPATGALLRRTATGESGWGQLVNGDVAAAGVANIAVDKLAHLGLNNILKGGQAGSANAAGQVVNADVAANAGLLVSKLNAGGTAARVVGTTDGIAATWQAIASFIGSQSINGDAIVNNTLVGSTKIQAATMADANFGANTIHGNKIQDRTITSALASPGWSQAITNNPPWTWLSGNAQVGFSGLSNSMVLVIMFGWVQSTAAVGTVTYAGIGDNTNTGVSSQSVLMQPNVSQAMPFVVGMLGVGLSGTHTYYGVGGVNPGSTTFNAQMIGIRFDK